MKFRYLLLFLLLNQYSFASRQIVLTWNTSDGAITYNIYRGTDCSSLSLVSTGVAITTWTDTDVLRGQQYCYAVTAVNSNGESAYSNTYLIRIPMSNLTMMGSG